MVIRGTVDSGARLGRASREPHAEVRVGKDQRQQGLAWHTDRVGKREECPQVEYAAPSAALVSAEGVLAPPSNDGEVPLRQPACGTYDYRHRRQVRLGQRLAQERGVEHQQRLCRDLSRCGHARRAQRIALPLWPCVTARRAAVHRSPPRCRRRHRARARADFAIPATRPFPRQCAGTGQVEAQLSPAACAAGRQRVDAERLASGNSRAGIPELERCRDGVDSNVRVAERRAHTVAVSGALGDRLCTVQQGLGAGATAEDIARLRA